MYGLSLMNAYKINEIIYTLDENRFVESHLSSYKMNIRLALLQWKTPSFLI